MSRFDGFMDGVDAGGRQALRFEEPVQFSGPVHKNRGILRGQVPRSVHRALSQGNDELRQGRQSEVHGACDTRN